MNRIINLENMDIQYWLGELPNISNVNEKKYFEELICSKMEDLKEIKIALEIFLHKDISNYGLLGLEFIPHKESGKLELQIGYTQECKDNYFSKIRMSESSKYIFKGLDEFLVSAVKESVSKYNNKNEISEGILKFDIAANCQIGSSPRFFEILTGILLEIACNIKKDEICESYMDELIISTIKSSKFFK